MLAPREQVDPYLIETENGQTVKYTKLDADKEAQNIAEEEAEVITQTPTIKNIDDEP